MTVAATITSKQYPSNGVSLQYPFPNKIFAATDLVVTLIDTNGNLYPFTNFANATLGLSYTVQGVDVDTGCTVVFSGIQTSRARSETMIWFVSTMLAKASSCVIGRPPQKGQRRQFAVLLSSQRLPFSASSQPTSCLRTALALRCEW